jgi:hypothetical protein
MEKKKLPFKRIVEHQKNMFIKRQDKQKEINERVKSILADQIYQTAILGGDLSLV